MSSAASLVRGVHLVVAVKELAGAKSRLGTDFDDDTRAQLVLAMLTDTLAAALPAVTGWSAVTPDPRVAEIVAALGGAVISEPQRVDTPHSRLNAALASAASVIRASAPALDVLALQADLPALRTTEIAAAIEAAPPGRSVVLDHTGRGTAALILRGAGDLDPRFGTDSARRHLDSGARTLTGRWPGLRLDVDTPEDLRAAVTLGIGDRSRALLEHIGWLGKE